MAKQLNINLAFTADTGKAKAQLQDLQKSLNNLTTKNIRDDFSFSKDIEKATKAAIQLKIQLENATNAKTGNLDLTRFNESIKKSGMSLKKYQEQFRQLGPEGDKAFAQLANSIMMAEIPLKRSNALISEMWVAMKNTARWQISSSVLHGFMGALEHAYGYAKNLNKSLNDIRIVTGQSVEQMADFAKEANNSAKALSATTNEYAKASLIYYQQGLSDEEVKQRTDITIKMAHAAGQSAQIVSDQMTAVWNNFYEQGDKSLEHYANVMTALGAATASSTDEIAGGLEKFASVADMIGLSYEYAASALATITATTRQSEDVVGTALKTIFARIQGLKLGETLEDGVNLNKYSEALESVGISIFDASGELKNMDNILDEMGNKWNNISKAQQVALAQTVAGTRQYNQLVSLMDNWDFFEENLSIANNSEGALQEQADIYADSWEASADRVKASAESIYSALINDEAFIDLNDALSGVLGHVENTIEALGGLKGVLFSIGTIVTTVFRKQIAQSFSDLASTIHINTENGKKEILKTKKDALDLLINNSIDKGTLSGSITAKVYEQLGTDQLNYLNNAEKMSEEEKQINQSLLDRNKILGESLITQAESLEKTEQEEASLARQIQKETKKKNFPGVNILGETISSNYDGFESDLSIVEAGKRSAGFNTVVDRLFSMGNSSKANIDTFKEIDKYIFQLKEGYKGMGLSLESAFGPKASALLNKFQDQVKSFYQDGEKSQDGFKNSLEKFKKALVEINDESFLMSSSFSDGLVKAFSEAGVEGEELNQTLKKVEDSLERDGIQATETAEDLGLISVRSEEVEESMANAKGDPLEMSSAIVTSISAISSFGMVISALEGVISVFTDESASAVDQIIALTSTAGILVPTLLSVTKSFKDFSKVVTVFQKPLTLTGWKILAIVAAISVAIVAIKKIADVVHNVTHKQEIELEKSKKAVGELTASYDALTKSAEEFDGAINHYDEAKKGLQSLNKETEEYNKALIKANEEALALAEKYNLWSSMSIDENGLYSFDPEVLQKKQLEYAEQQQSLQSGTYSSKLYTAYTEKEKAKEDFKDDISGRVLLDEHIDFLTDYAKQIQEKLKAPENVGLTPEEVKQRYNDEILKELFNKYGASEDEEKQKSLQYSLETIYQDSGYIDSLNNFVSAVDKFDDVINGYTPQITNAEIPENIRGKMVDMATDENGFNQGLYNNITNFFSEKFASAIPTEEIERIFTKISNDSNVLTTNNGLDKYGYDINDNTDLAKEYAKQTLGDQDYSQYSVSMGENDEVILKDTQGEEILKATAENMRRYLAIQSSMNDLYANFFEENKIDVESTTEAVEALNAGGKNFELEHGIDPTSLLLSSFANGNEKIDFSSLQATLPEKILKKIDEMSHEDLLKLFGLNQEQYEALGGTGNFSQKFEGISDLSDKKNTLNQRAREEGVQQAKDEKLDVEEFKAYRNLLIQTNDAYKDNIKGANEVAITNLKLEKGVEVLAKNWKKYNSIMSETNPSMDDLKDIMPDITKGLQDVLDVSDEEFELLPPDFAQKNWKLIQDLMNGVEGSVDALRDKAGEEILLKVAVDKVDIDKDGQIDEAFAELHQKIAEFDQSKFEVGVAINPKDEAEFYATCNNLIRAADLTQEEATAYFSQMGYDAEITTVNASKTTPWTIENPQLDMAKTVLAGVPIFENEPVEINGENTTGGEVLAVKTITPKGSYGGGIGTHSVAPKTSRTPPKSGGGGKKSKKQTKTADKEIERYHQIKKEISTLDKEYSNLGKIKDQVFGKDKLKFIDQEIKSLEKLKQKQSEYIKQIKENAGKDKGALLQYGATFDDDNNISNWQSIMESQLKKYNEAVKKYNNGAIGEEAFKKAEEEYEKFKELVKIYEDSVEQLQEAISEQMELEIERISKELEKITIKIDAKIELDDRQLKYLDSSIDSLNRGINKMAEVIDRMSQKGDIYLGQFDAYAEAIEEIRKNAESENRGLTDDEIHQIWDYEDKMGDLKDSMLDMADEVNDSVLKEFDRLTDKIDTNISRFNVYSIALQHYVDIIKLSGRETRDSALLMELMSKKTEIAKKELDSVNDKYLAQQKIQQEAKSHLEEAQASGNERDILYWQEQYDEITKAVENTHNEVLESWKNSLQAASDEFEASIESSIQKLKDSITKYGLDNLADRYDKQKDIKERYLTDLDKEYELNKLINKVESSIDDTDNIKHKEELNKLLDEINGKQEKNVKMTKYDLEYLQKKYDLALAENALEDVRAQKTTMRLVRNDQGNYDYVYTADQENIEEAESNYEDKLYELKKLSLDHIDELSDLIIQNEQELMEALAEIDKTKFQTKEAYEAEVNRITQFYLDKDLFLRGQLDTAVENSGIVYEDTILGQLENTNSAIDGNTALKESTQNTTSDMIDAWIDWKTDTKDTMAEVGTSSDSMSEDIREDMKNIDEASGALQEKIDDDSSKMVSHISTVMDSVDSWRRKFLDAIEAMISRYESFVREVEKPIHWAVEDQPKVSASASNNKGSNGTSGGTGGRNPNKNQTSKKEPIYYKYSITHPFYPNKLYKKESEETFAYEDSAWKQAFKEMSIHFKDVLDPAQYGEYINIIPYQFDTGGYTGQWGPEGKMAMLHEKEIVLNKEDTKNILNAVDLVRGIGPNLFSQLKEFLNNNMINNVLNLQQNDTNSQPIEQYITIQADFPGVSTALEIEEALQNLTNEAVQYIDIR